MVENEQYFPRGGKKPKSQLNEKKKFDFLGNADRIGKKRKYRGPKINTEENEEDGYLSDRSSISEDREGTIKYVNAEGISFEAIQEGMVILGRVVQIYDTKIIISIPGRIMGAISANHISTPYTNLLKSFVEGKIDDIKKPQDLFHVGEYVSVKVLSKLLESKRKQNVGLSLMPQDINSGIFFSTLKEGMLLRAAVSSIEDHGYVLDLGVAKTRAFMPKKFADESLPLDVGQVIWCTVKKCQTTGTNSIVTLTNSLDVIKSSSISGNAIDNYNINNLKPGMALGFNVNKPLTDGAEGIILKNSIGYIHVSQIGSKLKMGQKVNARVLYIMPVSKLPFLTTRKIFEEYRPNMEEEIRFKPGEICENAKVTKVTKQKVILKLGKKEIGIIKLKESIENNAEEQYPTGSELKVRILRYHLSDYAYVCTDEEDIVEQKYFNLNDLSLGEYVEAIVEEIHDKYVSVTVGNLKGRIPELQVSDFGVFNQEKKPGAKVSESILKKKFKPGQKLQARVLKLNPYSSILHVTVKPSFLDPDSSILTKVEDAQVGKRYKGIVVAHLKFGVLIGFFGEAKAFVHVSQLSHEFIKDIPSAFFLGQVVNCTILSINNDKMDGSLIKQPDIIDQDEASLSSESTKQKSKKRKADSQNGETEDKPSKKKEKSADLRKDTCDNDDAKINKKKKKDVEDSEWTKSTEVPEKDKKKKKNKKDDGDIVNITKKKKDNLGSDNEKIEKVEDVKTKKKNKNNSTIEESNHEEKINKKKRKELEDDIDLRVNTNEVKSKKQKKLESKEAESKVKLENDAPKFSSMSNFFDLGASTILKNISKNNEESSGESDEEKEEEKSKKKKKKLSAAEKVEKARQEEEKLRAIEKELADGNSQPKSSDQFERLLLANPNCSELWIAYMAFHLQATEIERARSVGQKALKTISFREEQDKLNVWLALLNLENRFGTQESLSTTLQQALQMNDSFSVHSKMLGMYLDTGKEQDVLSLVDLMVSKYRNNPQTYIVTGDACFKINAVEKARSIMQKAVNRLEYKTHVPVLIKFAQLENNRGDSERAEALFEQIIGCLPQRVDIWCVYVDMLLKSKKIDSIRLVFERAVAQKLPLKKMKLLYKKWVEIEEKLGDGEQVEKVRKMALDFLNKIKC